MSDHSFSSFTTLRWVCVSIQSVLNLRHSAGLCGSNKKTTTTFILYQALEDGLEQTGKHVFIGHVKTRWVKLQNRGESISF